MSANEELIAEAYAHVDRAADAAPVSARQAILTGKVEDQRLSFVARLAHALEQVTAERDGLIQTITERLREAEARIEKVVRLRDRMERQRDDIDESVRLSTILVDLNAALTEGDKQ